MREVLDALLYHASDRPKAIAISDGARSVTYEELAHLVLSNAKLFTPLPDRVAILAENSIEWVIADLALAFCGKTTIPVPTFFSVEQFTHIIKNANARHILCSKNTKPIASALGVPISTIDDVPDTQEMSWAECIGENAGRIIYTSGTTGAPKGVRLGSKQITASAQALGEAISATQDDVYLSVLPFSLLLEQITAIAAPLLIGARVELAPDCATQAAKGDPSGIITAFEQTRPNVSVLVPSLLGAWVMGLAQSQMKAPDSLRFVAVGGAPVANKLLNAAQSVGIPAFQGYGLSECCSVVSVNRLGDNKSGTVGKPLDGINITIDDGEIVISGDTVMNGYLGDKNPNGVWRTGDLGEIDKDGNLRVLGRKDNILVSANGRNVNPEWIEALIEDMPSIAKAILLLDNDGRIVVLLAPAMAGEHELNQMGEEARHKIVLESLNGIPDYAIPMRHALVNIGELAASNLLTPSGEARRKELQKNIEKWLPRSAAA